MNNLNLVHVKEKLNIEAKDDLAFALKCVTMTILQILGCCKRTAYCKSINGCLRFSKSC